MGTIDIDKGFRQYSPKELLSFAYNGTMVRKVFELDVQGEKV